MQRINSTNRAANKFGAGKDGFQGGSPATGVKATYVTPEWTNAVQEELARAIEGAGIALDAAKYDQLLAAIKSIAWGAGKTESPWAPLASPTLAGVPTADTAPDGTNTKQLATTAFVQSAVGGYISIVSMGGTIVLTEAQASNSVIGFGGGLTSDLTVVVPDSVRRQWAIANWTSGNYKLIVKTASGNGVTVAQSKRNLVYSNGQHVYDAFNDFENISLSGVSTAPTAAVGTNTTQVATTAFVNAEIAADRPFEATTANIKMDGTQSVGTLNTVARGDHVHPVDTTRAPLASPALTGTPTAPTAAVATNTTQLASTAFVQNELNSRRYVSGELIMTNGGQITVSHGLGAMPTHATGWLKCVTANLGYAVGDMVLHPLSSDQNGSNEALTMTVTSTQLIVRVGEAGPYLGTRKDNGSGAVFSAANWRLILKASL